MKKTINILLIGFGLSLIFVSIMAWVTYYDLKSQGPRMTKCYDRLGHEIIGVECLNMNDDLSVPVFITFISLIMGLMCFFIGGIFSRLEEY